MDLNKLRVMQMIQLALAKKGIESGVHVMQEPNGEKFAGLVVNDGIDEVMSERVATESELLEWHAEIERV